MHLRKEDNIDKRKTEGIAGAYACRRSSADYPDGGFGC